jgi:mRNA-degrading endonuclease toxin of MazEF toxin-antitoxin module
MALTLTSTAYSATPRSLHSGVESVSFDYTTPAGTTLSASANATVVLGPKIPNQHTILMVVGSHTSGAATMPVDIGVDGTISALATQKAAGTNAIAALSGSVPYRVSVSDDAIAQYSVVKFGLTPGTDTAVANLKYTVFYTRDP